LFSKRKVAALVAEFLGTGILAFVILTVSRSQIGIPYFVAIAAGLAVGLLGIALQRDVHLNPALTLGLWTARRVRTVKAIAFIVAQLLGGLAAYSLYKYFSRGAVQELPTAYDSRVLVAEALGAFAFAFVVAGVGYQRLHPLVRSAVSGAGLTIGIILASVAAAGFINPAVALANNAWAWSTYILGPVLGAIIGVNLYGLLFAPKEGLVAEGARATSVSSARTTAVEEKVAKSTREAKPESSDKSEDKETKKSAKKKSKK
jgi:glycerol uptake facilitator-like aquaporin